ncbi:hypothetical protein L1286_11880 [Pseudoalteromonas sp. SMS1]|uniref:hypothetical protein n=1 Tax=Pseudoalteromonas sp. SMS1 TaxID=2908894 RepID=UPI001F46378B|nr:hypothetical protein [Pseudoalteromonas sp. SMS1]MCF2858175.1 hypothetical protein [Pseudoalteromonas sp. SMS1]
MRYFSTFAAVFLVSFVVSCSDLYLSIHESSEKSERSVESKNCTLEKPCFLAEGVKFWVSSLAPKPETPFNVVLEIDDPIEIQSAYLEGVSMYMGKIPITLVNAGGGQWRGEAMVGACNLAEMQWRLKFFDTNNKEVRFSATIYTYR